MFISYNCTFVFHVLILDLSPIFYENCFEEQLPPNLELLSDDAGISSFLEN